MLADPALKARFKVDFSREEVASRAKRGFDPDQPDKEWLKLKRFLVVKKLSTAEFTSADLVPAVAEDFKQLIRLNRLLEDVLT